MSVLTGNEIEERVADGRIFISDFDIKRLGPNSYNLRLFEELLLYEEVVLDMKKPNRFRKEIVTECGYTLQPGQLYLGRTMESTRTEGNLVPLIEGRSSIARLGMTVHQSAGFGDTGFNGTWTLEISVLLPLKIYPHVEVCQIFYLTTEGYVDKQYTGKYQGLHEVRPSLLYKELNAS